MNIKTPENQNRQRKRVAAYCRVSTLAEEQELSYETQRAYYENLIAQDPNMTLVGIYGDQGCSGLSTDKRVEFKQMVQDALNGKIDVIMVKSISRFSRNTIDFLNILRQFKEIGVQVLFEKEGLDSLDLPSEMILLSILASIAQNESANISENMRWMIEQRSKNGTPCRRAPYGYKTLRQLRLAGKEMPTTEQNCPLPRQVFVAEWLIDPEPAKRIRLIFKLAYQGFNITRITQRLNEFEADNKTGYIWKNDRVIDILRNEAYCGDILTAKSIQPDYLVKKRRRNTGQADQYYIQGHHAALIEPAVFDQIQHFLDNGVLFANHTVRRKRYLSEHPAIKLPGAEAL